MIDESLEDRLDRIQALLVLIASLLGGLVLGGDPNEEALFSVVSLLAIALAYFLAGVLRSVPWQSSA